MVKPFCFCSERAPVCFWLNLNSRPPLADVNLTYKKRLPSASVVHKKSLVVKFSVFVARGRLELPTSGL